jgi:hypothetical protein
MNLCSFVPRNGEFQLCRFEQKRLVHLGKEDEAAILIRAGRVQILIGI